MNTDLRNVLFSFGAVFLVLFGTSDIYMRTQLQQVILENEQIQEELTKQTELIELNTDDPLATMDDVNDALTDTPVPVVQKAPDVVVPSKDIVEVSKKASLPAVPKPVSVDTTAADAALVARLKAEAQLAAEKQKAIDAAKIKAQELAKSIAAEKKKIDQAAAAKKKKSRQSRAS